MLHNNVQCIVLGGSAGCRKSIKKILAELPADFTIPLIIVRHIYDDDINSEETGILSKIRSLDIVEPEDKEPIKESAVYLAPSGYHLMIEKSRTFSLSLDEKINCTRPAIDVLFESAADVYGENLAGILLSGSNSDGAFGLCRIKNKRGLAIVQNPQDAEFPQMPQSALELCNISRKLTINQITDLISDLNVKRRKNEIS